MVKWGEIKKHKFFAAVFASIIMLCGIGLGWHLYSMANAMIDRNMWITLMRANRHLAESDRMLAEADRFFEEIDREQNLYHVFSKIAGTVDDGAIGYCRAMRERDGRYRQEKIKSYKKELNSIIEDMRTTLQESYKGCEDLEKFKADYKRKAISPD